MPNTTILLSALGFGLVFCVLIKQWQEIRHLRHIQALTAHTDQKTGKSTFDTLFTHSPFPLFVADSRGKILWGNSQFWKLAHLEHSTTLQQLDQLWGSTISDLPTARTQAHHLHISIRAFKEAVHERRIFTLVTWKYPKPQLSATAYMLIEQTAPRQRRLQTAAFEHQLITYITELTSMLDGVSKDSHHISRDQLKKQVEEARSLTEYLHIVHQPLRRQLAHERVNLSNIWKEVFHDLQPRFHAKHIHVLSTIPHAAEVFGNKGEYSLALRLLIESILEIPKSFQDIEVHVAKHGRITQLSLTLPTLVIDQEEIRHLLHFSQHSIVFTPITKLKMALAQQIMIKYHGSLHITSEKHVGTQLEVVFVNAEQ